MTCTFKYMVLLFLFFSLNLSSQPKLEKLNYLSELPELTTEQLTKESELQTFNHGEGVIVYNSNDDQWKLFKYLENYKEKGKVLTIQRVNGLTVISLEFGTVILLKDQIYNVEAAMFSAFSSGNLLIALSSEIDKTPNQDKWEQDYKSNTVSQILFFNIETAEIQTIKLEESFYRLESCTFYNNKIWVSVLNDSGEESWWRKFLEIDLTGKVKEHHLFDKFQTVQKVFTYADKLYITGDSGIFILNENDRLRQIVQIDNCADYLIVNEKNLVYFLLNKHPDNKSKEIEYIIFDLNKLSSKKVSFTCNANSLNYSDYKIHEKTLLCNNELMYRVDKIDTETPHAIIKYLIRDGLTTSINYLVEDQNEIWFTTKYNGLYMFSKVDSTWHNYMINKDLRIDSTHFMYYDQITLNEGWLFISLRDSDNIYRRYLIYNRTSKYYQLLTKNEFINRFILYENSYVDSKGEMIVSSEYPTSIRSVFQNINEWTTYLFLNNLPFSGSNPWHYNKVINKPDYNILSIYTNRSLTGFNEGVIIKYKNDNKIKIVPYPPRPISNFKSFVIPYMITGNDNEIYVAGNGNDSKGFFQYSISDKTLESHLYWYNIFHGLSFIKDSKEYVVIGIFWKKLYGIEKETQTVVNLSSYISSHPRYFESVGDFNYVGTEKELVYFDKEMNFLGKLYKGNSKLINTDFSLYLDTGHDIYRIKEN